MSVYDDSPESLPPHPSGSLNDLHIFVIEGRRRTGADPYALGVLFLEWAWGAEFPGGWPQSVRALACALRGLRRAGLIERRTIRRPGHSTHHGLVLTTLGHEALKALGGEWLS